MRQRDGTGREGASAGEFGENFFEGGQARGIHHAQQAHFQMQARVGLAAQIVVRVQQNLEKTREIFFAERAAAARDAGADRPGAAINSESGAADARDQQIAEMADGLAAEMLQILSFGEQSMNQSQSTRVGGSRFDRAGQFVQDFLGDDAEKFAHLRVGNVVAAVGARLLQQRKCVAQAAIGGASHHGEGAGLGGQTFSCLAIASSAFTISAKDSARK